MKKFTQLSLCFLLGFSVWQPVISETNANDEFVAITPIQWEAEINNYSIPHSMYKNSTYSMKFNVTNNSSIAWTKESGIELVSLGEVPFQWTNLTLLEGETILPGETKSWETSVIPTGAEGTYPYSFRMKSSEGGFFGSVISGNIELIGTYPNGTVSIKEDSEYTNNRLIHLLVNIDGTPPFQYQIKENATDWSEPAQLVSIIPYTLTNGFGKKTITVKIIDVKGRETELPAVSITLDDVGPAASFSGVQSLTNQSELVINGYANDLIYRFSQYDLSVMKKGATDFDTIQSGTMEVFGDSLGVWDTTGLSDGDYILKLASYDVAGNKKVVEHPIKLDRTAPVTPFVNQISDASTSISGKAEAGASVSVYKGSVVIGKGVSDANGNFSISIPKQAAGILLRIRVSDSTGNLSEFVESKVLDKTPPAIPTVNPLYNYHITVTGKTSPNSKMELWSGTSVVARGTANSSGLYTITIQKQAAGKVFYVKAVDAFGNRSLGTKVVVVDKIAPMIPTVSKINSYTTIVSGKAEAGSYVYIKKGTAVLKSTVAKSNGTYSLIIPKQKKGTYLVFYSKDKTGNTSKTITVRVQ